MLRRLAIAALLALFPAIASAQFATIGPTPAVTDNGDRLATTAWINNFVGSAMPLASGKIWIGSAGNIAVAQTLSGDMTVSVGGVTTFATVNANIGSFGSATQCVTATVNAKGLTTAISAATCTPAIGSITGTSAAFITAAAATVNGTGGFVTSPVANANLANSTISGVALGGTLNTLTFGTHLASGAASYNGSAIATLTSDATAANTASTIMARDGSGQVAATTFTGALAGNATSATSATNATNATNTGITDDTATNATMFPTWVTANTGNLPQKTTSSKLTFNPSTGALSSSSFTGAGTGLTGTAASLTAGTVTTNANLTGDVTSSGNTTTLASTISAGGPTGSTTVAPVITYDAKGRLTAVTTATIAPLVSSLTDVAWVAYTPSSALSTPGTSVMGTPNGHWKQIGKTVFFSIDAAITTVGTGTGSWLLGLPTASTAPNIVGASGKEVATLGALLSIQGNTTTTISVLKYDNTSLALGGNGTRVQLLGTYEVP
jgi:hypothetical protein